MQVLYVHGMGRSPVSGWPMLRRLRRAGFRTQSFGHWVSRHNFATIVGRLAERLDRIAGEGDYTLIGHSLGGVLLREALRTASPVRPPARLFLLGSPVQMSSIAARMGGNPLYRLFTGDCGRLLGSPQRMDAIGAPTVPVTAIVGDRGWSLVAGLLPGKPNDGIVTVAETAAPWLVDVVRLPVAHMLLPSDARVTQVVLDRLRSQRGTS